MRRNKLRGILGILMMALTVVAMYFWLTYGSEAMSAKSVLIAAEDITEGVLIEPKKHFAIAKRNTDSLINGCLTEKELQSLNGMAANQFIPKNAQLNSNYFSKPGMVLSENKVVFKIPNIWIYAVPSSIRRGDDIEFYDIDSAIESNLNSIVTRTEQGMNTYSDNSIIRLGSSEPVLCSTVLYVKDSTNREVIDADSRLRMDGSSQVSSIEIACTTDDFRVLENRIASGMRFIIVYK